MVDSPSDQATLFSRAVAAHQRGDLAVARRGYAGIRDDHPAAVEARRLDAVIDLQQGDGPAALQKLGALLERYPDHVDTLLNCATAARLTGDRETAAATLEHARTLAPDTPAVRHQLGTLALESGQLAAAVEHFQWVLARDASAHSVRLNLTATLIRMGEFQRAQFTLNPVLALDNPPAIARKLEGMLLLSEGHLGEALKSLQAAAKELPEDVDLIYRLASTHEDLGQWDQALALARNALAVKPDHGPSLGAALMLARRVADWDDLETLSARCLTAVRQNTPGVAPFGLLAEDSSLKEQQQCARTWTQQFRDIATVSTIRPAAPPTVGFISNGFQDHPTGLLIVELLERLNKERWRWIVYSTGPDDGGSIRQRIRASVHRFVDASRMSTAQLTDTIRADALSVLFDLRGYGGGAVTEVLAARPAPVQAQWLAYPGTMGAPFIDFILADPVVIPTADEASFDETVIRLPHCYQPNDTTRQLTPSTESRAELGLPEEGLVFCSFNNSYKISPQVFACWMRILGAVPGSVLWLLEGKPGTALVANLRQQASRAGIAADRLVFMPKTSHLRYLTRYQHADLFLDTAPYNAHTTASDALFAGCPVLTRTGQTFAGRVAASILQAAGLSDLICASIDDYQNRAVALANDPDSRTALRERLRRARQTAPLFDMRRFARDFEQAVEKMRGEIP